MKATLDGRIKAYKVMLLLLGVAACSAAAICAQFDSARGGILAVVSAVFFRTYLPDHEGWAINLFAGGLEGFSMSGYFYSAYFFVCGAAVIVLALVFLFLKPTKGILSTYLLVQFAAFAYLSYFAIGTFDALPVVVAVAAWVLLAYYGLLMRSHWQLAKAVEYPLGR